jgi:aldose 1-epimerase
MLLEPQLTKSLPIWGACLVMSAAMFSTAAGAAEVSGPHPFGATAEGVPVESFTLTGNKVTVKVISRGATITEILAPDRTGKLADVVLGFDNVAGYESVDNQFFGCTTGRVCNRIAKGQFTLDGQLYQVALKQGEVNHLHGGVKRSLDKLVWAGEKVVTPQGAGVRFKVVSPDGDEGYPGNLTVTVTYVVSDQDALWIEYGASTDRNTPVNLTNHSYFNLAGAGEPTVLDHELQISATEYTAVDAMLIPTGKIEPVAGTALDFSQPTKVGARIDAVAATATQGYDHNFVLTKRQELPTFAAKLKDPTSGRVMSVFTTQPGLQLYTGNHLSSKPGKGGKIYAPRSALCLETQHFPDSVNQPMFPSTIVKPNEPYKQTTVFAFSAE